jgi:hypothetical protein
MIGGSRTAKEIGKQKQAAKAMESSPYHISPFLYTVFPPYSV